MKAFDVIFFDFDGVILESLEVKGWAFGKLFEQYPDYVDEIVAFHHANGGMSRFDKFRHIHRHILNLPLSDPEFNDLCQKFSELSFSKVLRCEFVPGVLNFLDHHYKNTRMYVVSGTPHEEIIEIVKQKKLGHYFNGVYGSPTPKEYWVRSILDGEGFDVKKSLFIGDAMSEVQAAAVTNIAFAARIIDGKDIFEGKNVLIKFKDFVEFETFLNAEN